MTKHQQVEVLYVSFYGVMLLIGGGLAWVLADANPRAYRRMMLPLGLITGRHAVQRCGSRRALLPATRVRPRLASAFPRSRQRVQQLSQS